MSCIIPIHRLLLPSRSSDPRDSFFLSRHPFIRSVSWPFPQESFLSVSLRNLLLVGESVGESIDVLFGEGKRSR
jgi:hypothetical protein